MKVKTLIPLIIYLLIVGGIGYKLIPTIVGDSALVFGAFFAGVVLGWFFYWLGISMTKPRDKAVEVKRSYYYPLVLHTVGCLVYAYMLMPLIVDSVEWLSMAFFGSLVSFTLYYIAGMIVAHRDMQGKDVYFTQDAFSLSLLFLIPTIFISLAVTIFWRNNSTALLIGTIVEIVFGAIFFYLGISMSSGDGAGKTGLYKFLIFLFLWVVPSAITLLITPIIIELNLGNFFMLWVSALSILVSFCVLYALAIIITAKIYQTKTQ
jgi:hypothetical protein